MRFGKGRTVRAARSLACVTTAGASSLVKYSMEHSHLNFGGIMVGDLAGMEPTCGQTNRQSLF
jgi:hypothetical protein